MPKRQFNLADYVQVKNASFDNGLLKIELVCRFKSPKSAEVKFPSCKG
jgi:HSP20 family molecular chaperone IbpA